MKCIAGGHVEGTVFSGRAGMAGYPEIPEISGVLRQLKGRKIGVPGNGSIHDVILRDCLDRSGLKDDIQVNNYRWADEAMESFVRQDIDAVCGTPALAVAVQHYSDGKILFPPSLLWPNNPSYGILVQTELMKKERAMVSQFIRAHEEATRLIREQPRGAAEIIAEQVGFVDAEFVHEVLRVSPKYCAQLTGPYVQSTMEFSRAMKKCGYIRREVSRNEIFDMSVIEEVHPAGDHYGSGIAGG